MCVVIAWSSRRDGGGVGRARRKGFARRRRSAPTTVALTDRPPVPPWRSLARAGARGASGQDGDRVAPLGAREPHRPGGLGGESPSVVSDAVVVSQKKGWRIPPSRRRVRPFSDAVVVVSQKKGGWRIIAPSLARWAAQGSEQCGGNTPASTAALPARSQRVGKTGAAGERLKESGHINQVSCFTVPFSMTGGGVGVCRVTDLVGSMNHCSSPPSRSSRTDLVCCL